MPKGKAFCIAVVMGALFMLPSGLAAQEKGRVPETLKEKESYSIGYQVGASMVKDEVEVDSELFMLGLRDAVNGSEAALTDEEMRNLIVDLRARAQRAQLKKVQEAVVRNAEESRKFLEENARKDGVQTTDSGLQYMVLEEGEGRSPGPADLVTVHYRGTFPDGTEFDNSYAREKPQSFQTDGVIKGWTEALQMMKVGSRWKVFLPPDLAYGRGGMGQVIPPNQVLIFEMELLSVQRESE